MAIQHKTAATYSNNSPTASVTLDAGTAVGDLVVVIQQADWGPLSNLAAPSSPGMTWTARADTATADEVPHTRIHTSAIPAGGGGARTISTSNSRNDTQTFLHVFVIPGGTFVAAACGKGSSGSSHVAPSLAGGQSGYLLLTSALQQWLASGGPYTPPANTVSVVQIPAPNYDNYGSAGYETLSSSGATGTRTWSDGSVQWATASVLVAVQSEVDKAGSDTVAVAATDSAARLRIPVPKSGSDSASVALTEASSLFKLVSKSGSDSLAVALAESGFVGTPVEKAGADAVTVALGDASAVSKPIDQPPVADTAAVAVTDAAAVLVVARSLAVDDTLALGVDELAVIRRDIFGTDTLAVAAADHGLRNTDAPVLGTRVSPPLVIPEGPIAGSAVIWEATAGGGTVLVETSVDNGATWQAASNGGPVPRLLAGTSSARTVLTRVTLSRPTPEDRSPRLHRLEVQVSVDSSRDEAVPVGVFTLNDTEVEDGPRGQQIELSGADLSRRVARNRWEDTYIVEEGTNYAEAIKALVADRLPGTTFNFASTSRTTPRLFFGEQSSNDPWQDAQDMAVAIGYELFFDATGICTLRPEPDPNIDASVWEFNDTSHPTMVELVRRVTDENTYNKVIATGEGSFNEVPVRATAIDDDPASPTYHLGPYGTVTLIVRSAMILSEEQAQDAADALLRRVKGATEAVELQVVPMPALEPGDVVSVLRDRSKVEGRFLIDQLQIPLGAGEAMRAVGRRQRL